MRLGIFLAVFLLTTFSAGAQAQVVTLNKGGFLLRYDCTNRTALRYEYTLTADTGRPRVRPASSWTPICPAVAPARPPPTRMRACAPATTVAI